MMTGRRGKSSGLSVLILRRSNMSFIRKMFKNEKGATAIEYGLIAALIAVAAIAALGAVGDELNTTFEAVNTALVNATTRSEARRVGKVWVSTCRYLWATAH